MKNVISAEAACVATSLLCIAGILSSTTWALLTPADRDLPLFAMHLGQISVVGVFAHTVVIAFSLIIHERSSALLAIVFLVLFAVMTVIAVAIVCGLQPVV